MSSTMTWSYVVTEERVHFSGEFLTLGCSNLFELFKIKAKQNQEEKKKRKETTATNKNKNKKPIIIQIRAIDE